MSIPGFMGLPDDERTDILDQRRRDVADLLIADVAALLRARHPGATTIRVRRCTSVFEVFAGVVELVSVQSPLPGRHRTIRVGKFLVDGANVRLTTAYRVWPGSLGALRDAEPGTVVVLALPAAE
jgi:hypothetical protein